MGVLLSRSVPSWKEWDFDRHLGLLGASQLDMVELPNNIHTKSTTTPINMREG